MMRLFNRSSPASSNIETSPQSFISHNQTPTPSPPPVFATGTGPPRPIRLVYCDENGKFRMDPEAVTTLQLVKGPIGVVSVCGRPRQGKSFILNQLLGRSSGFQVASTHRPCTKGLWMWSAPLKRTALDGTEYSLLLLDSEGIDAVDQTGTYSTQIFSLAVLLSSMFIYNQMGGIDEAALDRLSLVTEMTKHIRVKASEGRTSATELGQFSPIFVWLLRDFYLDLTEDNRKITPRDYLELALRPVQGGGKDIAAKNEIRESIQALFPDRECFTLVRPLNNEKELQQLDQVTLVTLRPEFRTGLDALTKFVLERTRPKQVGATTMTGPILAGITQSFLDALNNGAVPTISSSWQSVEEAECRRAYDSATEVYMSAFDRTKPAEEAALREAHEDAVQKSIVTYNVNAVGSGAARHKYEKLLHSFLKKAFEDYKRNAFMEADLRCSNTIRSMEKKLRAACLVPDTKVDNVLNVLDDLLSEYEMSSHGPEKWQKLATFLHRSLEGQIADLSKKQLDQVIAEKNALSLQYRSIQDRMELLHKQLEASTKSKSEYLRRYEDAINDKKQIADDYTRRLTTLQNQCSSLDERCSSSLKSLESAKREVVEWRRKYEQISSKQKAEEDHTNSELINLRSRIAATETWVSAAREQVQSAEEEAAEWKRKFDFAARETKAALEKAATAQEHINKQAQLREDVRRAEFSATLAAKEEEIKDKVAKADKVEQHLAALISELKASESKLKNCDFELSAQKLEIKELSDKFDAAKATSQSFEREVKILEQEKIHLEQKYSSEFKRFEEIQERCSIAENKANRATELADKARADAVTAQKEKTDVQRVAMERLTQIERSQRHIENLERVKVDLEQEVERVHTSELDALSKVSLLESRVEEREKEIESLLESSNAERVSNVKVLESLLENERKAREEANLRAEEMSVQLQSSQGKLDLLQQELITVRLNESALSSKLKTSSRGKRSRLDDSYDMGVGSVEVDEDVNTGRKRSKSTTSPLKFTQTGVSEDDDKQSQQTESGDHTKFTIVKLRQEITKNGFGAELLQLKNPNKKDILSLYEKYVLTKKSI